MGALGRCIDSTEEDFEAEQDMSESPGPSLVCAVTQSNLDAITANLIFIDIVMESNGLIISSDRLAGFGQRHQLVQTVEKGNLPSVKASMEAEPIA